MKRNKYFLMTAVALGIFILSTFPECPAALSGNLYWTCLGTHGLFHENIHSLWISPSDADIVIAGTENGIYRSEDGGYSWTNQDIGQKYGVISVLHSTEIIPGFLFAGIKAPLYGGSVLYSINDGVSWHLIESPPEKIQVSDICGVLLNGSPSLIVGVEESGEEELPGDAEGKVFIYDVMGDEWEDITFNLSNLKILSAAVRNSPESEFCIGTTEGIFKLQYESAEWIPAAQGLTGKKINDICFDPSEPDALFAATEDGLYAINIDTGCAEQIAEDYLNEEVKQVIVTEHSGIIFAVSASGIWKGSADEWELFDRGLENTITNCLALSPLNHDLMFAGTTLGVFRTSDGGSLWFQQGNGLGHTRTHQLQFRHQNDEQLYAATQNGLYLTCDGGLSWSNITGVLGQVNVKSVEASNLSESRVLIGGDMGVCLSDDDGMNWTGLNQDLPASDIMSVAIHPENPDVFYAGAGGSGLFKSTDAGLHWNSLAHEIGFLDCHTILFDDSNPSRIFAGTSKGIYYSLDDGVNWQAAEGAEDVVIYSLSGPHGDQNIFYAGSEKSFFCSSDCGLHWQEMSQTICRKEIRSIAVHPQDEQDLFIGTYFGVYHSTDGGIEWTKCVEGLGARQITSLLRSPRRSELLFAGSHHSGVFKSVDDGESWTATTTALGISPYLLTEYRHPVDTGCYLAGTSDYGVYISKDYGVDWGQINMGLPYEDGSYPAVRGIKWVPDFEGIQYLFLVTSEGVYRSADYGRWESKNNGIGEDDRNLGVIACQEDIVGKRVIWVGEAAEEPVFYISEDFGENWIQVASPPVDGLVTDLITLPDQTLLASMMPGGIFQYPPDPDFPPERHWQNLNNGLGSDPSCPFINYRPAGQNLWTAAGSCLFRKNVSDSRWTKVQTGPVIEGNILSLTWDTELPHHLWAAADGGIYYSFNDGDSWTDMSQGLQSNILENADAFTCLVDSDDSLQTEIDQGHIHLGIHGHGLFSLSFPRVPILQLNLNQYQFQPGEPFLMNFTLDNRFGAPRNIVFYLAFQIRDSILFWPEWNEIAHGSEGFLPEILLQDVILQFPWPDYSGVPYEIYVYGGLTDSSSQNLIGQISETSFTWIPY